MMIGMMIAEAGCSHKVVPTVPEANGSEKVETMLPEKVVYKMRGDWADKVPVTLDERGNIESYPDPVDVSDAVKPVALGDGWYLDRKGVNRNTAFLDWTYEEYRALKKVPDMETLKAHIIARHAIVEMWNCGKSQRSIEEYRKLVAEGFPGCQSAMPRLSIDLR